MRSQVLTSTMLVNVRSLARHPIVAWIAIALLLCSSCALRGIEASGAAAARGGDKDLRGYIERVFRLQNRVLAELIMAEELSGGSDPANAQLESRIVTHCRYLVESATVHMEGKEPSLTLKKKVLETVGACEEAAKAAQ